MAEEILTDAELEEIKKRFEESTPGHWLKMLYRKTAGPVMPQWIIVPEDGSKNIAVRPGDIGSWPEDDYAEKDFEFIVHAHDDIPRLIAEIERLKNKV